MEESVLITAEISLFLVQTSDMNMLLQILSLYLEKLVLNSYSQLIRFRLFLALQLVLRSHSNQIWNDIKGWETSPFFCVK